MYQKYPQKVILKFHLIVSKQGNVATKKLSTQNSMGFFTIIFILSFSYTIFFFGRIYSL